MSSKILNILAKKHTDWIRMAKSFKLSSNDANELVQEMYLRIHDYTKDVNKIMYNETEVNTFYVYITLKNLYYSKFGYRKKKKVYLFSEISTDDHNYLYHKMKCDMLEDRKNKEKKINLEALYDKIDEVIEEWYWYDKKLTKLYLNTNMSMRDISKETKISLSSIFNTLTNAKEKIRKESEKEYKKYKG